MNPLVRRILEATVAILALVFISATAYYVVSEQRTIDRPTPIREEMPFSVTTVSALDIPCRPWPEPTGLQFVCLDTSTSVPALHRGTLEEGLIEPVLADARFAEGIWDVAWSDDSHTVLLILRGEDEYDGNQAPGWPVLAIDVETGAEREETPAAPGATFQRRPDGSIVYQTQEALAVFADGTSYIVPFGFNASVYPRIEDTIRLAPNDDTLAARLVVAQAGGALRLVNRAEQRERLIDRNLYRGERTFSWSPAGTGIAYANRDERTRRPALWLFTLANTGRRQLWEAPRDGTIDFVTWLPDGETLLFTFIPDRSNASVETIYYAFPIDGRDPIPLWENGYGLAPANGGETIVFRREFVDGEPVEGAGVWMARLEWH